MVGQAIALTRRFRGITPCRAPSVCVHFRRMVTTTAPELRLVTPTYCHTPTRASRLDGIHGKVFRPSDKERLYGEEGLGLGISRQPAGRGRQDLPIEENILDRDHVVIVPGVHRPAPRCAGRGVGIRAVRALRPYESDVVGEVRAVKRIVEKKSRRDTNTCVRTVLAHLSIWRYGYAVYQCDRRTS